MVVEQPIDADRGPANLYIDKRVKRDATKLARERYDLSLSLLVERLLVHEMSLKRGVRGLAAEKRQRSS